MTYFAAGIVKGWQVLGFQRRFQGSTACSSRTVRHPLCSWVNCSLFPWRSQFVGSKWIQFETILTWCVCLFVCLSVCPFPRFTYEYQYTNINRSFMLVLGMNIMPLKTTLKLSSVNFILSRQFIFSGCANYWGTVVIIIAIIIIIIIIICATCPKLLLIYFIPVRTRYTFSWPLIFRHL